MSSAATAHELATGSGLPDDSRWPTAFRPVLSRLVADSCRYFESDCITVEPVRHVDRPFSTLLQIRVANGSRVSGAFVKILKPRWDSPDQVASMQQNVVKEFTMTSRVHQALIADDGADRGLAAVRPIACFPDQLALVTEQATGPRLTDVLTRRAARWSRTGPADEESGGLGLAARWLKAVQTALPQDRHIDVEALRTYLDKRFAELERTGPIRLTRSGRSALERCRDCLISSAGARDLRQAWIHADFCPDNIIADSGRVTVLDFTMAKTGTAYHDLAHLFLRVDAMRVKPWVKPAVIDRYQHELLEAFEPGLEADRPLFALMLLQHVVCHLVTLQASMGPAARVSAWLIHRRHRQWLDRAAGLGREGWTR
jgi:hypothetical protein